MQQQVSIFLHNRLFLCYDINSAFSFLFGLTGGRMGSNWDITYFKPDKPGVNYTETEAAFAFELSTLEECGVILYDNKGVEKHRFPFSKEGRSGALYGMILRGGHITDYIYNYYKGDQIITDIYAKGIKGLEKWGDGVGGARRTYGKFSDSSFDWQEDAPLRIPLEDSILYGLNVRAFTMHKSSGVKNRGTFEGIVEKIPYLTKLGITAVELMSCYEYEECMFPEKIIPSSAPLPAQTFSNKISDDPSTQDTLRLNCWGFQKGFYFAPKVSYSASLSPEHSFKFLVKELHKNGIEVIMQFYFPPEIKQVYMLEVIKFWVKEYHIDGVRISGFHIPYRLFAEEAALKDTKIWCTYLPQEVLDIIGNPLDRNFMTDNENFRQDMRRYLKGDEGLMNQVLYYQRRNPKEYGVVNYLADYDGFSLYDSVSYEKKHNEANGENNHDGNDVNFTWNCGVEGDSRKKSVLELRLKQIKNALTFVFLAQGIPFIFSGDEFANSRNGNNNCYCQDNENGWLNWKKTLFSAEITDYVRFLICLRKENRILHMKEELLGMDLKNCGYPDISYHGTKAWIPDLSYISRMAGILLCGQYTPDNQNDSFYIAFNMHWEKHELALPKLPKGVSWVKIADTSTAFENQQDDTCMNNENSVISVKERSIVIYRTRKLFVETSGRKRNIRRKKQEKDG